MLLKHLYTGRRKSDFILLKDNLQFSGGAVIKKFIDEALLRKVCVHLVLTENLPNFNIKECEGLTIHRYFPDPWNLLSGREAELDFKQIVQIANATVVVNKVQVLLVICSITSLLPFVSLYDFCDCLNSSHQSSESGPTSEIQVLCLVHSELMPNDGMEYKRLLYMATSVINLIPGAPCQVDLKHRQNNGKIIHEIYTCAYNSKKGLEFEIQKNDKPPAKSEAVPEVVISSTFKLTLEDKEKESRNQVVLPYVKTSTSGGKGKIYYEPDVNDDWDDEDPDDDLEI